MSKYRMAQLQNTRKIKNKEKVSRRSLKTHSYEAGEEEDVELVKKAEADGIFQFISTTENKTSRS